jgi:hypothetical protein
MKSLHNTTANGATKNVKDIQFWGNGDAFKLICKASSEAEGWISSTKAYEIPGVGCVVQVSTQQRCISQKRLLSPEELKEKYPDQNTSPDYEWKVESDYTVAEAITFVPGVRIENKLGENGEVISRELVAIR